MVVRNRYIYPLRQKEYACIKVKITHRNMRKLAAMYKEVRKLEPASGMFVDRMRLRYSLKYWKFPNRFGWYKRKYNEKKYVYVTPAWYSYWMLYAGRNTIYIKSINKSNEYLIRYSIHRMYRKYRWENDLPF